MRHPVKYTVFIYYGHIKSNGLNFYFREW